MAAANNIKAGRAFVEVTADSSKLRKSLGEAQSQLRAFSQSCSSVGRELLALGGAMSLPFVLAERSFAGFDDRMRLDGRGVRLAHQDGAEAGAGDVLHRAAGG